MVLRRDERQHAGPVGEREERHLLAHQELLDHHREPGVAEGARLEALRDRPVRLLDALAHHHALARGEAVGLHHQRRAQLPAVAPGRRRVSEGAEARGRDAVTGHEVLGEGLRALEPRRGRAAPEHREPDRAEPVGQAEGERGLGPDHHEVGPLLLGQGHELVDGGVLDRHAAGVRGDAGVAGRGDHAAEARALGELPRERVLAPAAADQEHVGHSSLSGAASSGPPASPSRWARAILAHGLPRSSSR